MEGVPFSLFPPKLWTQKRDRRWEHQGDCVRPKKEKLLQAIAQHLLWTANVVISNVLWFSACLNSTRFPPGNQAESACHRCCPSPGEQLWWEAGGCRSAAAFASLQQLPPATAGRWCFCSFIFLSPLDFAELRLRPGKAAGPSRAEPKKSGGKTKNTYLFLASLLGACTNLW